MRSEGDTMPSLGRGLFILSPLVLYPVVDFIFRIANGLIAPDLRSEFDLNAAVLGFISSVFFVAFGLSQLPLGLALDRYGPRALTRLFLTMASLGAL
ncbi:MAG: MFS transporter [Pseudomonadota bacterium]|nr:MFS transporter [Pseudomonadota bacterium]